MPQEKTGILWYMNIIFTESNFSVNPTNLVHLIKWHCLSIVIKKLSYTHEIRQLEQVLISMLLSASLFVTNVVYPVSSYLSITQDYNLLT